MKRGQQEYISLAKTTDPQGTTVCKQDHLQWATTACEKADCYLRISEQSIMLEINYIPARKQYIC